MKTKQWIGFCLCLAALAGWASAQDRGVGVASRQIGADLKIVSYQERSLSRNKEQW